MISIGGSESPGPAHRARNDLVRAAECQHEHVHPEKHGSVPDDIRLLVEDCDEPRRKEEKDPSAGECNEQCQPESHTGSLFSRGADSRLPGSDS
mgnify:CR=1 FL=1